MKPNDDKFKKYSLERGLFGSRLDTMLDMNHPLVRASELINWRRFETKFGELFKSKKGRPATPTRIVVALLYLKHTYDLSDEEVIERVRENAYWQYFCGFDFFDSTTVCHSTVLVKWRKKMGEEGLEEILQETLAAAKDAKLIKTKELDDVIFDTTVQEKNVRFPTDARLYDRMRETLVREAKKREIPLRQTYTRTAKGLMLKYQGYSHAKQFKRAKKPLKKLKTILGRVTRDIDRKCESPDKNLERYLNLARKLYNQKKSSKNKIFSIHEPHVECISKGKAHKRYEFGCKVSIATTNKSNWVVGAKALHGNPFDGHTLEPALDQVCKIVGRKPKRVYVDRGYKGAKPEGIKVLRSGRSRGLTSIQKRMLRRRSAVEPVIGHLKSGHRLGRNFLSGQEGDKNNAILAGAGRNFAKLLLGLCLFYWPKFYLEIMTII